MNFWLLIALFSLAEPSEFYGQSANEPVSAVETTNFSREEFVMGGRRAFVLWPPIDKRSKPQPWVLYAPVLRNYPDKHENWLFNRLARAGIAVAGVDVGESYGSPHGRKDFTRLYVELTSTKHFSDKPCLLARSRGGLWALSWAIEHPEKVAGVVGIYPVFDLRSYPGTKKAAAAYDMKESDFKSSIANYNPIMKASSLAEKKIPMYLIHGDADQVVPLIQNAKQMVRVYEQAGVSDLIQLEIAANKGHSSWQGYFQNTSMLQFIIENAKAKAASGGRETGKSK